MSADRDQLEEAMRAFIGIDAGAWVATDPVNEPMIRHFCEVVGDQNPIYRDAEAARAAGHDGIVAPPTMLNAWTMPAFIPPWAKEGGEAPNKEVELHQLFNRHGYTGVVATNQEEEYFRYLRPGDHISAGLTVERISEQKATPLGLGYFIDVRWNFRTQTGEAVGTKLFRVLKFKPAQQPQPVADGGAAAAPAVPRRLRPVMGHDNQWWWDALDEGALPIQRCGECGVLRHPPRPMCGACRSTKWDSVRSQGQGTVYSHTVIHHPVVPGYEYPLVCALVELDEGTRCVSNVVDCDPSTVHIGMRVKATIEAVDGEMKLPVFRPVL